MTQSGRSTKGVNGAVGRTKLRAVPANENCNGNKRNGRTLRSGRFGRARGLGYLTVRVTVVFCETEPLVAVTVMV
jgi:hypothetical protein